MRSRIPDEQGLLLCIECQSAKTTDEFYLTGRTSGGVPTYFSTCKACKSDRERAKRRGEAVSRHTRDAFVDGDRSCVKCGITKPYFEFPARGGRQAGQRESVCKECKNAARREWAKKNPQRASTYRRPYHEQEHYLKRKYGISVNELAKITEAQENRCWACRTPFTEVPCAVDHDHETGEVRGLLCKSCNSALGLLQEKVETMERLIQYKQLSSRGQAPWRNLPSK